jgi:hypothetical protein
LSNGLRLRISQGSHWAAILGLEFVHLSPLLNGDAALFAAEIFIDS